MGWYSCPCSCELENVVHPSTGKGTCPCHPEKHYLFGNNLQSRPRRELAAILWAYRPGHFRGNKSADPLECRRPHRMEDEDSGSWLVVADRLGDARLSHR